MPETEQQEIAKALLSTDEEKERYDAALAEVEPDLTEIEAEFDDGQRLSEEDFVVRINARD
jgi:hypothetical protein